jgi:pimeloyl-ACP methyl ester carboxylesterase
MQTATNGEVELAYELTGPQDAPVVAFVEGLGYGRWMWNWQVERLDEYRRLVWDNRGTGDASVPEGPYEIAEMAADFEAVLEDAGVDRAHVVGASMGGMIAIEYALTSDRAATLSLLCTSHGGESAVPTPPETQQRMFDVPAEADEREAIRYKMRPAMSEDFFQEETDLVEQIVDWRLDSDAPEPARMAQAAAVEGFDREDDVADIGVPTLVLHGTGDRVLPVENGRQLCRAIPGATCEFVADGSHLFFLEDADRVTEAIREHLATHPIDARA